MKKEPESVYRTESWGTDGHVIVEIRVFQDRAFNDNDQRAAWRAGDALRADLHVETVMLDPRNAVSKAEWLAEANTMFTEAGLTPVAVKEIPNEYCGPKCCPHRPWLLVNTILGTVKVGWRKQVMVIDWSQSDLASHVGHSDLLFPEENVTKGAHSIHAWSYEKAAEYLKVLYETWTC